MTMPAIEKDQDDDLMARGEIHVQLTVNFPEAARVRALVRYGRDARACRDLYVQMLLYCKKNLTDGFVPVEELGILVYPDTAKNGEKDATRLIDVGLIEPAEGGYLLPRFLKRNKSKEQVDAESKAKAKAGASGGRRSGQVRRGEAEAKQSASVSEAECFTPASVCLNTEVIGQRSETDTPPPTPPLPSEPSPTADEKAGEGDQDPHETIELALVAEVRAIRPEWTSGSIGRVLTHPDVLERPAEMRRPALLAVARDPESRSPGRLAKDGPWWQKARKATTPAADTWTAPPPESVDDEAVQAALDELHNYPWYRKARPS